MSPHLMLRRQRLTVILQGKRLREGNKTMLRCRLLFKVWRGFVDLQRRCACTRLEAPVRRADNAPAATRRSRTPTVARSAHRQGLPSSFSRATLPVCSTRRPPARSSKGPNACRACRGPGAPRARRSLRAPAHLAQLRPLLCIGSHKHETHARVAVVGEE